MSITITEGEIDCLSVAQVTGLKWPVVSLKNGAGGAVKELRANMEYLAGFKDVVLMFDMDDKGQEAAQKVCEEMGAHLSLRVADLGQYKDANEALLAGDAKAITDAFFDAPVYRPDGIVNAADLEDWFFSQPEIKSYPYPFPGVNTRTHGLRKGELVTITAGTGIGKSAFIKEIAYSLANNEDQKLGVLAMEENVRKTLAGIMSLEAQERLDIKPKVEDTEDNRAKFRKVFSSRQYELYDHFGSIDINRLLSIINFMVVREGCQWIILDHISIIFSGLDGKVDERREVDRIMTELRSFVERTGVGMILVAHLKRPDGSKGHEDGREVQLSHLRSSQAIAQLSDMILGLERNTQDEEHSNVTTVRVLKNRYSGELGACCQLMYDPDTGRMFEETLEGAPF